MIFFARIPEPPVYRRRDDPVKKQAAELLPEGEALLAAGVPAGERPRWCSLGGGAGGARRAPCCLIARAGVEAAEACGSRRRPQSAAATAVKRLWSRTDEKVPEVFRKASRRVALRPGPEPMLQVKLVRARAAARWATTPSLRGTRRTVSVSRTARRPSPRTSARSEAWRCSRPPPALLLSPGGAVRRADPGGGGRRRRRPSCRRRGATCSPSSTRRPRRCGAC